MNILKQSVFLLSLFLFFTAGCKSVAYFHTSNDVSRENGTIYMEDGTEKNGQVTIFLENSYSSKDYIQLSVNGKEEKIHIRDIKGYKIQEKYYVPRFIDLDGNGVTHLLFVQRLTNEGSKIHLYELYQRNLGNNANGEDPYTYYISLPANSKYEVWNASSKYLVPRFDEKMSRLVADCPALAQKIEQQTKGYFYGQFTLSDQKKAVVLRRIIDEYNQCK